MKAVTKLLLAVLAAFATIAIADDADVDFDVDDLVGSDVEESEQTNEDAGTSNESNDNAVNLESSPAETTAAESADVASDADAGSERPTAYLEFLASFLHEEASSSLSRTDQDRLLSMLPVSSDLEVSSTSATRAAVSSASSQSLGNCSMSVSDYLLRDDTVQFVYSMFVSRINDLQRNVTLVTRNLAEEEIKLKSVETILSSKKNFTDHLEMLRSLRNMVMQLSDRHKDARSQLLGIIDHYIALHKRDMGVDSDGLKLIISGLKLNVSQLTSSAQTMRTQQKSTENEMKELGKVSKMADEYRRSVCALQQAQSDLRSAKQKLETCSTSGPSAAAIMNDLPGPSNLTSVATFRNFHFYSVNVRGPASSIAILQACERAGLLTVCDHSSYYDGKCIVIQVCYVFLFVYNVRKVSTCPQILLGDLRLFGEMFGGTQGMQTTIFL
jgi:hypothetical protein